MGNCLLCVHLLSGKPVLKFDIDFRSVFKGELIKFKPDKTWQKDPRTFLCIVKTSAKENISYLEWLYFLFTSLSPIELWQSCNYSKYASGSLIFKLAWFNFHFSMIWKNLFSKHDIFFHSLSWLYATKTFVSFRRAGIAFTFLAHSFKNSEKNKTEGVAQQKNNETKE